MLLFDSQKTFLSEHTAIEDDPFCNQNLLLLKLLVNVLERIGIIRIEETEETSCRGFKTRS